MVEETTSAKKLVLGEKTGSCHSPDLAYLVFALSIRSDDPDLLLTRIALVGEVINGVRDLVYAHNFRHIPIAAGQLLYQAGFDSKRVRSIKAVEVDVVVPIPPTG